jgi:hypothetical protein
MVYLPHMKNEYLTVRIASTLKRDIANIALNEDRSVSNVANRLLLKGLAAEYQEDLKRTVGGRPRKAQQPKGGRDA